MKARLAAVVGFVAAVAAIGYLLQPTLSNTLLSTLQDRFPRTSFVDDPYGIVILGGSFDGLDAPGERVSVGLALAQRFPHTRILFSGFDEAHAGTPDEFFVQHGIDASRIVFEDQSRDTNENAAMSRAAIGKERQKPWVLITSAVHMPRAIGAFRAQGFQIAAYPVEYRSSAYQGIGRTVRKELLGLLWYWLRGYSLELFPVP